MFLIGGDTDDLIQEGMIGLFKAIRDYRSDREASFFHFAELCINRQLYSAVEASNRKKHVPLNTYVSFYSQTTEEGKSLAETLLTDQMDDPEQLVIENPQLWWPNGYGRQDLYTVEVTLYFEGKAAAGTVKRARAPGFRRISGRKKLPPDSGGTREKS